MIREGRRRVAAAIGLPVAAIAALGQSPLPVALDVRLQDGLASRLAAVRQEGRHSDGWLHGIVVDAAARPVDQATIRIYAAQSVLPHLRFSPDRQGFLRAQVDTTSLFRAPPAAEFQTGGDGVFCLPCSWEQGAAGGLTPGLLRGQSGPFVLVASGSLGQAVAGVAAEGSEFFSLQAGDRAPLVRFWAPLDFAAGSLLHLQLTLDGEAPLRVPKSLADPRVLREVRLARSEERAGFGPIMAIIDSGKRLPVAGTGPNGVVVYDMTYLDDSTASNRLVWLFSSRGVRRAKVRRAHIPLNRRAEVGVVEEVVEFARGLPSKPILEATYRDGSKTVVQLFALDGRAVSNAVVLDTSQMDPDKLRPLTITLTWDRGDHTDIDLHVVDLATGQRSYFQHMAIDRGSLDLDNVEGFGPETFTARPGRYRVMVHYYDGNQHTRATVRVVTPLGNRVFKGTMVSKGQMWDVTTLDVRL